MNNLSALSDEALLQAIERIAAGELEATIELLHHLNEIERRDIYRPRYSCLFNYLTSALGMDSGQAGRRSGAAKCLRLFPNVEDLLRKREVSITSLSKVVGHLTPENASDIISGIRGLSVVAVDRYLALLNPERKLPKESVRDLFVEPELSAPVEEQRVLHFGEAAPAVSEEPLDRDGSEEAPLPPVPRQSYKEVKFYVTEEEFELIERSRILRSRGSGRAPSLGETIVKNTKDALRRLDPEERVRQRRERRAARENSESAETRRPEGERLASRYTRVAVQDEVMVRDGGRCVFPHPDGTVCGETVGIQLDHVKPFALGGTNTPDNLRLLCKFHNAYQAERVFGKKTIDRCKNARRSALVRRRAGDSMGSS